MTYLLDTTVFSAMMRREPAIRGHIEMLAPADRVMICTITRGEIRYGLDRLPRGKRRRNLEAEAAFLFSQLPCLAVTEAAANHYARIKRQAERKGTPLDENDLWIAAAALSLNATLVTADSDFRRLSHIPIVDWTE